MREKLIHIEWVRVTRPIKLTKLRVRDFDDSITVENVSSAVAVVGVCGSSEVRVGLLREALNGLRTVWIRCPLLAAKKVRIHIGLLSVRVDLLDSLLSNVSNVWRENISNSIVTALLTADGAATNVGWRAI